MIFRSYREVDEHDGIAESVMASPRTLCSKFSKCGGNISGIANQIELYPFQNSSDDIADVGSDNIITGRGYSLPPLMRVNGSKRLPILLENLKADLSLVDFLAATKRH